MVLLNNRIAPTNDKDEAFLGLVACSFGGESVLYRKQGAGEAREEPLAPPQMISRLRGKGLLLRAPALQRQTGGSGERRSTTRGGWVAVGKALSPLTERPIIKCIHFLCAWY